MAGEKLSVRTTYTGAVSDAALMHIVTGGASYKLLISKLRNFIFSTGKFTAFATGGQTDATPLTAFDNLVDVCATSLDSVKLLPATVHERQTVRNEGAEDVNIYPNEGDNFLGLAADVPIPLSPENAMTFTCFTAGEWQ